MTNREIREGYLCENAAIAARDGDLAAVGASWEERARAAHAARHQARLEARRLMEDPSEVEDLQRRDRAKYGNPDGPTFDYLLTHHIRAGATTEEAYQRIVGSAPRSDPETNRRLGIA